MNNQYETDYSEDGRELLAATLKASRMTWRHEQIIEWGEAFWHEHYPEVVAVALWANEGPASTLARQRIKGGRKLKGSARYVGYRSVACPVARSVHHSYTPGRKAVLYKGT